MATTETHLGLERDDLRLLGAAAVVVPLVWVALGWRWGLCVSGYDAWATALPLLSALTGANGDWAALAYRPDLLGGTRLRDGVGPNPVMAAAAALGLSATAAYNVGVLVLQVLAGFLGGRTALDLARTWSSDAVPPWAMRVAAVVLTAFAPALGWRVGYGHLAMTIGLLTFMAALAAVAAAASGRMSVTLAVVAAGALANGLLFTGHQLVLYGAVFGMPLLAGMWLAARPPWPRLAWPLGIAAVGAALAAPGLAGVLAHGFGSDSPRAPHGLAITYSYLTAGSLDWASSLLWTRAAIPAGRPLLQHHESNVPIGPLLLLLALVPWPRLRALGVGLGLGAALVLVFSMDVRPFSTALLALVPPLGSFRVPTRAALPLLLALPALAVAAVSVRVNERAGGPWRWTAAGAAAAVGMVMVPSLVREPLAWAAAAALLRVRGGAASLLLLALAGGSIGAFRERLLLPLADTESMLAHAAAAGRAIREAQPELASPLRRVLVRPELPELGPNTAFAAGVSSLEGYFFPSRRLIALERALRGQPYDASTFVLRLEPEQPWSVPLLQLYGVSWRADLGLGPQPRGAPETVPGFVRRGPSAVSVSALGPAAPPAWFARRVEAVESFTALAAVLRGHGAALHLRLPETAWVVAGDAAVASPPLPAAACGRAAVRAVRASATGRVDVETEPGGPCPLVIATNYAESLRAMALLPGGPVPARTFPAYGALLGVWAPEGTTAIRIAPSPHGAAPAP